MDLYQHFIALSQIIVIDLVLAGDNAIVVGMAASRVHPSMRARVILWGISGAVVLRILFAAIATQLLTIVGLTLAGGILLLWVCWKMYREITLPAPAMTAFAGHSIGVGLGAAKTMTFGAALTQIIVADVSMSLDNVLAVALLSAYIAKLLARYHWITWIGLAIVLYVAMEMIWTGTYQIGCQFVSKPACDGGALRTLSMLLS